MPACLLESRQTLVLVIGLVRSFVLQNSAKSRKLLPR